MPADKCRSQAKSHPKIKKATKTQTFVLLRDLCG
jgi:hypothetical protein